VIIALKSFIAKDFYDELIKKFLNTCPDFFTLLDHNKLSKMVQKWRLDTRHNDTQLNAAEYVNTCHTALSITTRIILTFSIMTLSIMTLSITTLSIMTLCITTLSIMTLSLTPLSMLTLVTQHNDTHHSNA
jgi:hypothetical protein